MSGAVHPHLNTNPLTTLLDMLKAYAADFFKLATALGRIVDEADIGPAPPRVPVKSNRMLVGVCREMREACVGLDLKLTISAIDRFLADPPDTLRPAQLASAMTEIRRRALDELNTRHFLYLEPSQVRLYQDESPVGREVQERFPEVRVELIEGAKCKALGRHLAAAFHFGRALEFGLRWFTSRMGVAITASKPTWFTFLDAVRQKIDTLPNKKPAEKRKKELCRRVYEAFDSVRVVWRNPMAHDLNLHVTPDDSENLMARTRQVFDMLLTLLTKKRT